MGYIFIESQKRVSKENTNSNNIHIVFNSNIHIKEYIKILNLVIPKTCYLINNNNNKLKITFSDTTIKNISIPINNYDTSTLWTTIKNLVNYSNFDIVFDDNKYIYTFWANQSFQIEFPNKLYKILGMNQETYISANNIIYWGIINFNIPMYINIDISNIESSYITTSN